MAEIIPKLNPARAGAAGTMRNISAETTALRVNFLRINFFSERVKIKPSIDDPLKVAQAHVPEGEADNGHGKIQ